jgi:hypothetical protein
MKKIIFAVMFGLLVLGAVLAYAATCDVKARDRKYEQCLVDRQCGEKNLCKSECLNYANKWYYNRCKD